MLQRCLLSSFKSSAESQASFKKNPENFLIVLSTVGVLFWLGAYTVHEGFKERRIVKTTVEPKEVLTLTGEKKS